MGLFTLGAGAGVLRLELRTDGEMLHPRAHPLIEAAEADRARFRDPRQLILLVQARAGGPAVASPEGLRFLREIHAEARRLSSVRAVGILSLAGIPRISRDAGGFSMGSYLDRVPDRAAAFDALVARLRELPLTDGLLLSRDDRLAALYLPLANDRPVPELVDDAESWIRGHDGAPFDLALLGPEMAEATLGRMVIRDLAALIPLMLGVLAALLFLLFGCLGGVVVPLAEAGVVLVWTLGIMGWIGIPVTLITTVLPVVLMTMAITDEIHLLERVRGLARGPRGGADEAGERAPSARRRSSILSALDAVGRPIVATSLTTALGFLSFLSASVAPLKQFGLFTALGILLAMLLTFCWVPALIVSLPPRWFEPARGRASSLRLMQRDVLGSWAIRRPGSALCIGVLAIGLAAPGIARLEVQDSWVDNFAPDAPLAIAERDYNAAFWGSYRFDVVFEGGPEFFYSPAGASLMEDFAASAARAPHVRGVVTYLTPVGEIARALGESGSLSQLSATRLGDLMTLAEMSESRLLLRQLITERGDAARARLHVGDADYARARTLERYLEGRLPDLIAPYAATARPSGDLPVALVVVDSIVRNQLRSVGWTLVAVTAVLFLFFQRGRSAFVAMVPVAAAVTVVLGAMGHAGMPLGIATSMFTALTVGVGVDFGIHFLHGYQRERRRAPDASAALRATTARTGRALRWNAFVLALGFLVLTLSSLKPNHSLGILLAGAMVTCYVATLLLLPRLVALLAIVGALLIGPAWVGIARADGDGGSPCPAAADASAREIMLRLERDFRRGARVVRMGVRTSYGDAHPLASHYRGGADEKILWAIANGDSRETWLLYVFSSPGRLAGTTLLIRDVADDAARDARWLYLRSFDDFSRLDARSDQVMVPGTALTYEDARGFVPVEKYDFSLAPPGPEPAASEVRIVACPKTRSIRENLGYESLLLVVDTGKWVVRRIFYSDLGGKALKRYELVAETRQGDRWFPVEIRLEHTADGYTTAIRSETWLLDDAPAPGVFRPDVSDESFLDRLRSTLEAAGLGERVRAEIAEADDLVRRYDERLRQRVPPTPPPPLEGP